LENNEYLTLLQQLKKWLRDRMLKRRRWSNLKRKNINLSLSISHLLNINKRSHRSTKKVQKYILKKMWSILRNRSKKKSIQTKKNIKRQNITQWKTRISIARLQLSQKTLKFMCFKMSLKTNKGRLMTCLKKLEKWDLKCSQSQLKRQMIKSWRNIRLNSKRWNDE